MRTGGPTPQAKKPKTEIIVISDSDQNMAAEEEQAREPQLGLGALQNAFHNIQMELRAGRMGKRIPDSNGDRPRRH